MAQFAAVSGRSAWPDWPDEAQADDVLHTIVAELDALDGLRVHHAEFEHYGSGYASFVEVWLTRSDDSLVEQVAAGQQVTGFGVLLGRLAPFAALQSNWQEWTGQRSSASSMPGLEQVAVLPLPGFPEAELAAAALQRHGYQLLGPQLLAEEMAAGADPDSNLSDGSLRVFDAWFYWYD